MEGITQRCTASSFVYRKQARLKNVVLLYSIFTDYVSTAWQTRTGSSTLLYCVPKLRAAYTIAYNQHMCCVPRFQLSEGLFTALPDI
jgi:hypothetical protein